MSACRCRGVLVTLGLMGSVGWTAVAWGEAATPRLPELVAPHVAQAPTLDGRADEAAWFGAGRLDVPTREGPTVHLRAVIAGDALFLLAQWPDATATVGKGAWYFDGRRWHGGRGGGGMRSEPAPDTARVLDALTESLGPAPRTRQGDAHRGAEAVAAAYTREDEDRLAFLWPIADSIPDFWKNGCGYACHTEEADVSTHDMWTNAPGERGDLWHWKSARSNPTGWADDQHLAYLDAPAKGGGRRNDPDASPAFTPNQLPDKAAPAYGVAAGRREDGSPFLLAADAVPLENASPPEAGDTLPAYILARPSGNRGDISAAGQWAEGTWSLELRRALETRDADDVQLTGPGPYPFALAVMDNGGGAVHTTSQPLALRILAPEGAPAAVWPAFALLGGVLLIALLATGRRSPS